MGHHLAISTLILAVIGPAALADGPAHTGWGYAGAGDPARWAELSEEYGTCALGHAQSPINIEDSATVGAVLPPLDLQYAPWALEVTNNGHTIQVSGNPDLGFVVEDSRHSLLQFHFHAPSEYHVNGQSFPLEVHLVHRRDDDGMLGVIGILFEEGAENPALTPLLANLPQTPGQVLTPAEGLVDVADLLPDSQLYYRLMGSLTTPPCSEGVNWYLMQTPVSASAEQIRAFTELFPDGYARPLQNANNRLVIRGVR